MPKLSSDLRQQLAATPTGHSVEVVVVVVVEVGKKAGAAAEPAAGDRVQRIAAMKASFSVSAEPIERAIESSGGTVIDRAMLSTRASLAFDSNAAP